MVTKIIYFKKFRAGIMWSAFLLHKKIGKVFADFGAP